MMDSGNVRNMQSSLSHKFENYCISLAFTYYKKIKCVLKKEDMIE